MKLSVVISAFNEEAKIEDCLKSVKSLADEIIVVDNESADSTVKIAKKYTSKVYSRSNNPMLNVNKNYGFSKATYDWILSLDADERVTAELSEEIGSVLGLSPSSSPHPNPPPQGEGNHGSEINGYSIPRKNIIFGKWIQNSIWWPDYQLRLVKRGKGEFPQKHVHEMIQVEGDTKQLESPMIHENYSSVSQYLYKLDKIYTESEAKNIIDSQKKLYWYDAIRLPVSDFLKTFFYQKGYRDGLHGLVLSILQAFYAEVVFAKVWERQGFEEYNSKDFLKEVGREINRNKLELQYWLTSAYIDETNSKVKKGLYRVVRKRVERKIKKQKNES